MSIFTEVQYPNVRSNRFDLSHDVKMSMRMGPLYPTCVIEAMPGDHFNISQQSLLRFAPLLAPVMHRVNVDMYYFFVPFRLLWPTWEKWITGDEDAEHPYIDFGTGGMQTPTVGDLADYLGYPIEAVAAPTFKVSAFPIAAYNKIWNDWFRDENLQNEITVECVDGDNTTLFAASLQAAPHKRAWMHDYFTSALPFAQKGNAVQIPLVTQNDVPVDFNNNTGTNPLWRNLSTNAVQTGSVTGTATNVQVGGVNSAYDPAGTLSVDVQAGATDINTLRRAIVLQEWLERNARGGTRYIESIKAHFNVRSSDARLQRPEYLGSMRQKMVISEVLNTAGSDTVELDPLGQMAGHGISVGGGGGIRYFCEEHGLVIGLLNVQPITAYQQGVHRSMTRFDRLDYPWPSFANIGEQEVRVKEIYLQGMDDFELEEVFGYVPRYAEYKYANNRVHGEFRSTLNFWHMGRIFAGKPILNSSFIQSDPTTRIFPVELATVDHLYVHLLKNISVVRKLPKFGIPSLSSIPVGL